MTNIKMSLNKIIVSFFKRSLTARYFLFPGKIYACNYLLPVGNIIIPFRMSHQCQVSYPPFLTVT